MVTEVRMGMHLKHLLLDAWVQVLAWNSATSYSLAKDILLPIAIFCFGWFIQFGKDWRNWQVIGTEGKKILKLGSVAIGLPALVVVAAFSYAVPLIVYRDHDHLVSENRKLRRQNGKLVDPKSRDEEIKGLENRLAELNTPHPSPTANPGPRIPLTSIQIASQKQVASADSEFPYGLELVITTSKDVSPTAIKIIFSGTVGKMYGHPPGQIFSKAQGGIIASNRRDVLIEWETPPFSVAEPITLTVYSKRYIQAEKIQNVPFSFPYPEPLINQQ